MDEREANVALGLPLVESDEKNWDNESQRKEKPRWGLLAFFVLVNLLTYMDRGVIASDGVNGKRSESHSKDLSPPPPVDDEIRFPPLSVNLSYSSGNTSDNKNEGRGIQGDFNLTNFEDGLLQSAFMVGFIIASLIFAQISKTYQGHLARLMGIGLLIFSAALVSCFLAPNYVIFLISRAIVGVGEASFVSLAAPVLDDEAPRNLRSVWLAIFYSCISVGYAFGYAYGSFVTQTLNFHWRIAFLSEAVLILIPAIITTFFPSVIPIKSLAVSEKGQSENEANYRGSATRRPGYFAIFRDLSTLFRMPVLILNILGYSMYTATVGVYAYWGPKAVGALFNTDNADFLVGAITALTGCIGTLLGGYVLSKVLKGDGKTGPATLLCAGSTFLSMGFVLFSFGAFSPSAEGNGHHESMQPWFYFLLAVGQILLFSVQGPTNAATLWAVESDESIWEETDDLENSTDTTGLNDDAARNRELAALRPLAVALATLSTHLFGDVPSPPLAGLFQDNVGHWRTTFLAFSGFLIVPVILWVLAWHRAKLQEAQKLTIASLFGSRIESPNTSVI